MLVCMKNIKKDTLAIYGLTLVLLIGGICFLKRSTCFHEPKSNLLITYRIQVKNSTNQLIRNAAIHVRVPIENTSFQHRTSIDANHAFNFSKEDSGQDVIHFSWEVFPPFTTKILTIQSRIDMWKKTHQTEKTELNAYLKPQPLIESEHELIQTLARRLKGESSQKTIQNIFDWTSSRITYAGYIKRARGALYALKYKKGDCTEFAYLFVALSRANGIPARIVRGFVCSNSMVLDLGDYHEWAEFYHDGQWHLADPQRKQLMREQNTYIAFYVDQPMIDNTGSMVSIVDGKSLKVKLN